MSNNKCHNKKIKRRNERHFHRTKTVTYLLERPADQHQQAVIVVGQRLPKCEHYRTLQANSYKAALVHSIIVQSHESHRDTEPFLKLNFTNHGTTHYALQFI